MYVVVKVQTATHQTNSSHRSDPILLKTDNDLIYKYIKQFSYLDRNMGEGSVMTNMMSV